MGERERGERGGGETQRLGCKPKITATKDKFPPCPKLMETKETTVKRVCVCVCAEAAAAAADYPCYSAVPPSQAGRCRSRRGSGRVLHSEDGTLSGRTRRQPSPPHTGTDPRSKRRGCHMARGTTLSERLG